MTLKSIFFFTLGLFILVGCSSDPIDVDASDVEVNLTFVDVDSTWFNADSTTLVERHIEYKNSIKDIYELELGQFLRIGNVPDTDVYEHIHTFETDDYIARLEGRIADRFGDKTAIKSRIKSGFQHLKYHFPNAKLPTSVVFLNTLFNASAPSTENEVGIGLERYLGPDEDVIKELRGSEYHQWMKDAWREEFMERDVLASWMLANVFELDKDGSLVEKMIHWGKILYFLEACFPEAEKHLIIRYSKEDYEWAKENEFAFWDYLVKEKLLFKQDERTAMNMLSEGPFTPGLPEKGPDRLGQFLGWKMVREYNEKNGLPLQKIWELSYNDILQAYETK